MNGVSVRIIAKLPQPVITHGSPWEPVGCGPVLMCGKSPNDVDSIHVVCGVQKGVHEEELADRVADVKEFDDHVQTGEVAATYGNVDVLHEPTATFFPAVPTEFLQEPCHVSHHELHDLVGLGLICLLLSLHGCVVTVLTAIPDFLLKMFHMVRGR